jgi:hypothetical protein
VYSFGERGCVSVSLCRAVTLPAGRREMKAWRSDGALEYDDDVEKKKTSVDSRE